MIQLYDAQSGRLLGEITEDQLRFLKDQLEEESKEDQDYYLNRTMVELFEDNGGDRAMVDLLRGAFGEREEMEIRWQRQDSPVS